MTPSLFNDGALRPRKKYAPGEVHCQETVEV